MVKWLFIRNIMRKYVSPFITYKEYQCSCCHHLPAEFYTENGERKRRVPLLYTFLFDAFADIREKWGKSIPITSGYRCPSHQQRLIDNGMSSPISAHMFGLALDLDCKNIKEVERLYKVIKERQGSLRIGYYIGTGTFIHIDTAYLIKPKLSLAWREGITWSK